jgi:uncharacterized BrkB/YihY/UPF0761 family membrane protein
MILQIVVGLFLAAFIILTLVFIRKSLNVPEQHEVKDVPVPENRVPYILISLVLFYPLYYVLHNIFDIRIEHATGGLIGLIALLFITFMVVTTHKYWKIDKLGYMDKYDYYHDITSVICVEALAMIYFLSPQ